MRGLEPTVCPVCGNLVAPVPIVFGYPSPDLFAEAEAGEVELGGCVVSEHDPTHRCPACRASLERTPDGSYAAMH